MIRSRREWERIRAGGLPRYLLSYGILVRGLPMALVVIVVIEWMRGGPPDASLLRDPDFYERALFAVAVFSLGGMASAWARWKAGESHFTDEAGDGDPG